MWKLIQALFEDTFTKEYDNMFVRITLKAHKTKPKPWENIS